MWPSHRQRELLRDTINPVLSAIEGSTVDRRNWHVTLVFIGNFPEQHLPGLWKAMDLIDPGEIRLRFDSLTFWQSPKIACIHAKTTPPELSQLMTKLHQAVAPLGNSPGRSRLPAPYHRFKEGEGLSGSAVGATDRAVVDGLRIG